MRLSRKAASGFQIIQTLGLMLLTIMASAWAMDYAYFYAVHNQLQTSADAAALAATSELRSSTAVDIHDRLEDATDAAESLVAENNPDLTLGNDDVAFGFIDPATKRYNAATFRNPTTNSNYSTTGGYNAVWVRLGKGTGSPNSPVNTIMANFFGVHNFNTSATSVALIDQSIQSINNGGVRPIYACDDMLKQTMLDGISQNDVVRIYGDHAEVNGVNYIGTGTCAPPPSGNWGFADFTNCGSGTVGASTIATWFASGYPGTVDISQCYSTKPGNFIASIRPELDTLISNGTVFPIPLYNRWTGSGSNTHVSLTGFVGFKITSYVATGAQANRYIEGRFYQSVCKKGCTTGTTGSTAPGGAMVKLRLASKS